MSRPRPFVAAALLVAVIGCAYFGSLRGGWLWDDDLHVTHNPTVVGPLGLKEIWSSSSANYFPLVLTNFWLQHALWDLDPLGYRVVTLLFHAGAALLLWRVLLRLEVPGAWLGATLWAVHPVQVESVAWICELKNTQSAVFFLAAILIWLKWLHGKAGRDYAFTLACALCAVLSKPSTVMLPVVLWLCIWWRQGRVNFRQHLALLPFLALSGAMALWTIWEQKHHSGALGPEWSQTFVERIGIAGGALWFYLGKLLWPASLTFIYPRWDTAGFQPALWLAVAATVAAALALWRWQRTRPASGRAAVLVAAYFAALLFPVLGFFNVYFFRYSFVGDHFQYLASMAPLAALGALLAAVKLRGRPLAGAGAVAACVVLSGGQSREFRSSEALWQNTVARNPQSAMAWAQLGSVRLRQERSVDAIACFQRALKLNPQHPEALNHLGCEYLRLGRTEEGIATLRRALEARPDFVEAQSNLGLALVQANRAAEAIPLLSSAAVARPDAPEPRFGLGRALDAVGRGAEALVELETVQRLRPNFPGLRPALASALNSVGIQLAQTSRLPEALGRFDEALRVEPTYLEALLNRGGALASLGRLADAREAFAQAASAHPDSAKAHAYLGQVLEALGRGAEALVHYEKAERLEAAAAAPLRR